MDTHANTVTWDEPDHIYSGYMSWKGDFGLNPEHPPLVKFVATRPLLGLRLNVPELQDRHYRLQAVLGGRDFKSTLDKPARNHRSCCGIGVGVQAQCCVGLPDAGDACMDRGIPTKVSGHGIATFYR